MSNTNNSTELTLQICFGVFGFMGTIATLAGLHHRDSLGCILIRRLIRPGITHYPNEDVESAAGDLSHIDTPVNGCGRRPTLPPSYEESNEDSENDSINGAFPEIDVTLSRRK